MRGFVVTFIYEHEIEAAEDRLKSPTLALTRGFHDVDRGDRGDEDGRFHGALNVLNPRRGWKTFDSGKARWPRDADDLPEPAVNVTNELADEGIPRRQDQAMAPAACVHRRLLRIDGGGCAVHGDARHRHRLAHVPGERVAPRLHRRYQAPRAA